MPPKTEKKNKLIRRDREGYPRADIARLLDALEQAHPESTCALAFRTPLELLVATILSAQCTDARVNAVTPRLFERFPDAQALASARVSEIEALIRSTGFFHAKARNLLGCAQSLVASHEGRVPSRMEELTRLKGVGRKTANIVLGHAFGLAVGIAVDTHVLRVSRRLGLASAEEAPEVEAQLMQIIPRERWIRVSDLLIFHGRKVCTARKPACVRCPVRELCHWPERLGRTAP
jgi:endonuclease-3